MSPYPNVSVPQCLRTPMSPYLDISVPRYLCGRSIKSGSISELWNLVLVIHRQAVDGIGLIRFPDQIP